MGHTKVYQRANTEIIEITTNTKQASEIATLTTLVAKILLVTTARQATRMFFTLAMFALEQITKVANLTNHIVKGLNSGAKCLVIFLDLATTFDTVSVLLLRKLKALRCSKPSLRLLIKYLNNRYLRVKVGSETGDGKHVAYGVPQASILGSTLFLAYINELCNKKLHNGKVFSFAEDTALVFLGESWERVFRDAQIGLNDFSKFAKPKCFKTQVCPFQSRKKLNQTQNIILSITNVILTILQLYVLVPLIPAVVLVLKELTRLNILVGRLIIT